MKLGLGTAQFGLEYGVTNDAATFSIRKTEAVLRAALNQGISSLDTAKAYGETEAMLGRVGVSDFEVVTKIAFSNRITFPVKSWVRSEIEDSLSKMRLEKLYGVLVHTSDAIKGPHRAEIIEGLDDAKREGLVENVGLSIYSPSELKLTWDGSTLVQVPLNVFDQRFLKPIARFTEGEKVLKFHVRSLFLQGLLLNAARARPPYFDPWNRNFGMFFDWADSLCLSPLEACLAVVKGISDVESVVVGIADITELAQIVRAFESVEPLQFPKFLSSTNEALVDPRHWGIS